LLADVVHAEPSYRAESRSEEEVNMSKKKRVEPDSVRDKRLAENTEEKIASRKDASDLLDERVRENIRQHGA
jgi:hypothetical protein